MSRNLGPLTERKAILFESLAALNLGAGHLYLVGDSTAWLGELKRAVGSNRVHTVGSLENALSSVSSDRYDTILLLPGTTRTFAEGESLTVSTPCRIMGLEGYRNITKLTGDDANGDEMIHVTANGVIIENLTLRSDAADGNGLALRISGASNVTVKNCLFDVETTSNSAIGMTGATLGLQVLDCTFDSVDKGVNINKGATNTGGILIKGCEFQGCTDAVYSASSAGDISNLHIRDCVFWDCDDSIFLDDTNASSTIGGSVVRCVFDVAIVGGGSIGNIGDTGTSVDFLGCIGTGGINGAQPAA